MPRRSLFTTDTEQICTVLRVGIFKAETSHIPGNEVPVSEYYFAGRPAFFTGRAPSLISRLREECFLLPYSSIPPLLPFPLSFPHTMHFLLGYPACWQVFSFSLHIVARVALWGTTVYLPPLRAIVLRRTWPRFGARVPVPVKFRRRIVYRADKFVLRECGPFVVSDTWRRGDTYAEGT